MISQKLALLDDHSLKEATFDSYDERKNNQCLRGTRVDLLADIQDWSTSPQSKCIFWLNGIAGAGKSTISRSVAEQFNKAECLGANFFFKRGDAIPNVGKAIGASCTGCSGEITEMLKQMYLGRDKEGQRQWASDFRRVVGVIITVFEPLSIASLESLLRPDDFDIPRTLAALHSVLDISESKKRPIRLFHLSFRDYLIDPDQCPEAFLISEPALHVQIAAMCVQLMTRHLRRDLCRLQKPGTMRSDNGQETLSKFLPAELRYACRYWIQHAKERKIAIYEGDQIQIFLNQHMLHWLEALALMGDLTMSIEMLDTLYLLAEGAEGTQIRAFVHDAKRFVLRYQYIVDKSPLQMYYSALMFSPNHSILRQRFWEGFEWLKVAPVVQDNWDACLQTLEGHYRSIRAVCFSPDGKLLASAAEEETIRLWDVKTGATHGTIEDDATAISFSPDNRLIGSAHPDGTIKLRDLGTQEVCKIFTGHSEKVNAIIFLGNGELLASASDDHTVRLWNTATGLTISLLQGHTGCVETLAVSQDGKLIASGSSDGEIRLWDVVTGKLSHVLEGHLVAVQAITFMHDNTTIGSADENGYINFWETSTCVLENKLETREKAYTSTFSPDGKRFAVTPRNGQIELFDTVTGSVHSVFMGHEDVRSALEFSPDSTVLASGSWDHTVKLWDVSTGSNYDKLDDSDTDAITVSPRGKAVASYHANSTKLWSAHTGHLELESHAVVLNQNEDMVACALQNHTINLQDLETGAPPLTLDGHAEFVRELTFSPNNKLLASVSSDQTVNLWDVEAGALCRKFSCTHTISEVVFSPDGKLLAIVCTNDTVELWSMTTETSCWTLCTLPDLKNVVFSPDAMLLASVHWWDTPVSYMWDTITKDQIRFDDHARFGGTIAFSPNSKLAVFISVDGILKLWDVTAGTVHRMLGGANDYSILSRDANVVFSPDGKLIASAEDFVVKLWNVESRTLVERFTVDRNGPWITSLSHKMGGISSLILDTIDSSPTTLHVQMIAASSQ
ncbi:WD40 repeat-like protein [Aureobasidium pullulans]|uniref:WD40 repeat-like protein n=1 Tax=Aureobasidium pullulans TaxID=5580 RepID=A0A4V4LE08_AURPU|nr:WD40 repeat-like protein [Aureobasidium pullulans]